MLDKKTEMMLSVANLLTAEELDEIRATAPERNRTSVPDDEVPGTAEPDDARTMEDRESGHEDQRCEGRGEVGVRSVPSASSPASMAQGERERLRTRESKISTACVGSERPRHDWWPIGTELVGRIGAEAFTAVVVENSAVKSGRSLLITSGPANGRICRTPTRAALEATEQYRGVNNLGRAGGVTNGWEFWQPKT